MVKFVIVDDDEKEMKWVVDIINKEVTNYSKKIITFVKVTKGLKEEIKNLDERKIYILDIELGGKISGINIAQIIREFDYESEIICQLY